MLHRYTIAFMLVAAVAGACSGSQNEGVSPGTAASTTTDTAASTTIGGAVSTTVDAAVSTTAEFVPPSIVAAVPPTAIPVDATTPAAAAVPEAEVPPSTVSPAGTAPETSAPVVMAVPATTVPDASTTSVVTAVPEVEVPPSTVSPAGTAPETSAPAVAAVPSTTTPEVLLRNGVAVVGWDLTVETAEVVDAAVEVCSEVFETSIMAGCAAAVWEACYSMRLDRVKLSDAVGPTNFEEPKLNGAVDLGGIFCSEAYTADVVELAMVLAAKYGDRYYSEDTSLPFGEDPDYDLKDFEYDFSGSGGGLLAFAEGVKRDFIDFRMYVDRVDWDPRRAIDFSPFRFISDEASVRVGPLFKVISKLKFAFSDSSSGPFEGFDAEAVIAFYSADSDNAQRVVDLPVDPEEIELFCDEAFDAARYRKQDWENSLNNCFTAADNCADTLEEDQNSMCGELSRRAQRSLKWNTLPRVCAAAEDIRAGNFDDSCRRSVLDVYLNFGDPRSATLGGGPITLVFFLAQPLIADLPREYRWFYSLPGP